MNNMAARSTKLDLNTAAPEALVGLPGITPELAERIIAHRPFARAKELLRVPGVEPDIFMQVAPLVRAGRPRPPRAPKPRRPRATATAVPAPAAGPPVEVHVHVNAAVPVETATFRTTAAPPPAADVIDPVVIVDAPPRAVPTGQPLAPAGSRALVPLGAQVSAALFESYAGPRVVFALFSFTLLAVVMALMTGAVSFGGVPPAPATVSPEPPGRLATQIAAAVSATLAAAPSPTPAPSATPAPTEAPPTPTTVFVSNSGLAGVGAQLFNETFVPPGYWSVGETDFSNIFFDNNQLAILVKTPGSIAWAFNGYAADDFYYQGLARLGACQLGDYAGLVFRGQDDNNLYLFGLSCDGRYRLVRRVAGGFQFLIDFTFTPEASVGSGAVNLLAVRAEARKLSLYVNDQFVNAVDDAAPARGFFGVFAKSGVTSNLRADFDDLSAWSLGP